MIPGTITIGFRLFMRQAAKDQQIFPMFFQGLQRAGHPVSGAFAFDVPVLLNDAIGNVHERHARWKFHIPRSQRLARDHGLQCRQSNSRSSTPQKCSP